MKLAKRTYALPSDTLDRFEARVRPGQRSAKVGELLGRWIEEEEREALRRDIIAGCQDMWDVYLDMAEQWAPLEQEVARAFDDESTAG